MDCLVRVQRGVICTADSPPWAVPQNGMPLGRFRGPALSGNGKNGHRRPPSRGPPIRRRRRTPSSGTPHRGWMCPRVPATGWRCLQCIVPCKKTARTLKPLIKLSPYFFTEIFHKNENGKNSKDSIRQTKLEKYYALYRTVQCRFLIWKHREKHTVLAKLVALGHYFQTLPKTKTHQKTIRNPSKTHRKPIRNPSETHQKPIRNPSETHRKPIENPSETHRKPSETLENPITFSCTPPFEKVFFWEGGGRGNYFGKYSMNHYAVYCHLTYEFLFRSASSIEKLKKPIFNRYHG